MAAENNNKSGCSKKKPPVEEAQLEMNENYLTAALANDDDEVVAKKNEEALAPADEEETKLVSKKNEHDHVDQFVVEEEEASTSERRRSSSRSKMATQFFLDYRQASKKKPGNAIGEWAATGKKKAESSYEESDVDEESQPDDIDEGTEDGQKKANRGAWSAEEDWELIKQVHTHGTSWAIILNESSILSKRWAGESSGMLF